MANVTQEDLNAVRQLMRVFRALEKFEPLIQKVLVVEEEEARLQREKKAALLELDQVKASIEQVRADNNAEMAQIVANKEAAIRLAKSELEEERIAGRARIESEWAAERKKNESERKRLTDSVTKLEDAVNKKRQESQQLSDEIKSLQQQKSDMDSIITKLAETRDKHKADITSLLRSIQADAEQGL